ncbi:DNA-binding transcriptional LysR family regulator [Paenibacillus phyllosphaerae]|uniref:DNA-binding transcriptional LysR family regulator n=1 Tax=Paenibacillus phyllosphaerae TaxID=274593 RepID=A0A7W5B2P2_9BACL|nr:LysR substrate-binding domain-containing protein [Paenibacillus phyllosphaerae]MBB3112771.1 DNA-binding transcriptional LysR family regulator [Paenibacillus phyllosphaerae]
MELLQLRYFQAAARLEHLTKAAHSLHISQPALSKMIATLEAELGTRLFERTSKSIRLNAQGEQFLHYVDLALQALKDGRRALADADGSEAAHVTLDVRVSSHLLPDLLAEYRRAWPDTQFHLLQHGSPYGSAADFDLCLSDGAAPPAGTASLQLLEEEIVVAVPAEHPLAAKSRVSLAELQGERFIMLPPGKPLRETTDALCRLAGFTPLIQFESDDPATVRGLIRAGQGVAFLPAITWGGSSGPAVVQLPLAEDYCRRSISLSWPQDRYMTKAAALFRDFTVQYFAKLAARSKP